jgi:hypothetical protein
MGPKGGNGDTCWYPAVYHERQCGKKVSGDNDLCTKCQDRRVRFAAYCEPSEIPDDVLKKGWCGLVTETVSKYQHTAGTDWANGLLDDGHETPVWIGEEAATLYWRARQKLAEAIRAGIVPTLSVEEAVAPAPAPTLSVEEVPAPAPAPAVDPRDATIATLTAERDAATLRATVLETKLAAVAAVMSI